MADPCPASLHFPKMDTVFDCQNPLDVRADYKRRGEWITAWKHRHGRWHWFEDELPSGAKFRVEWEDAE